MPPENNSKLFISEYTTEFVDRWDELIDWEKRSESEGGFFERILNDNNARTVLDIASGTGYHTVNLYLNGFVVTGSDGSANMVAKAKENAERFAELGISEIRVLSSRCFQGVCCHVETRNSRKHELSGIKILFG